MPIGFVMAAVAGSAYAAYPLAPGRGADGPAGTGGRSGGLTPPEVWPALLFLDLCSTGLAYALYMWGLVRLAESTAVTLPWSSR